ncbi:MAG TPA: hypothetical protein VH278_02595 [Burkholderiaceae bacterium]|nr:hypothetical protein [Burkholderiaceae bacterium]
MKLSVRLVLTLALCLVSLVGRADEPTGENKDLDLIPQPAQSPATAPGQAPASTATTASTTGRMYLENTFTQSWAQSGRLVPVPPPPPSAWEERLLFDVREEWRLGGNVGLTYSGRLNLRAQDHLDFPGHENVTNDLREAYASWEPVEQTFVDAGRINLKSGVALGFNPTDFFKTRAVVEPVSVDPVVLREDRLGTLMLRGQRVWRAASLTVAYAPAVASRSRIYTDADLHSFDPMFDRTNAQDRFLLKASVDVGDRLSPEFLAYHEDGSTRWGLNLTASVGQAVVAYAEWSGGSGPGLIEEALRFGRTSGTLPPDARAVLPDDPRQHFRNELAAGASYTTVVPKITFNGEFNYNQAGFSGSDWNNWFRAGRGTASSSPIAGELWTIRDYALDQQQPVSRSSVFVRADWLDAFVPKLELTGFVDTDLLDGSARFQLTADYTLSDWWTIGGLVLAQFGSRHSDFGSLPQGGSVLFKVARYF